MSAGAKDLLHGVRSLLLDLDGCVWFGNELAPGAAEFVAAARASGLRVGFLTNISSGSSPRVAAKLTRLGIPTPAEDVQMPIDALSLHPLMLPRPRTYVLGRSDVAEAVAGITTVTDDPDAAELLVLSRNPELSYRQLAEALQVLLRGGGFLALNLDTRVPIAGGRIVPGNGAIAAALTAASGVAAESVGKPAPFYFEVALERFGMRRESTVMVGDNLDSDVKGGRDAGLRTVQVGGSGYSTLTPAPVPDLSVAGLPELGELLGLGRVLHG